MGNWFSANSATDVTSDGQVNNNVLIEESGKSDATMLILTSIICAIKVFEFIIFIYKNHAKFIKERHERNLRIGEKN